MSQLSFTFASSSKVKTVHLVGTWDGYKGQLPLTSQGSGRWKGTFRFSEKTLKPGSRYWYYVSHTHSFLISSYIRQSQHQLTMVNSTSKMATNPRTTDHPALKSNPVPAVLSISSTSPNPPSPPLPLPSRPSANASLPTLHTQAAPSLHLKSFTPSPPSLTNPVVCARQTTRPPPASMTWPINSRRLPCTRCATSPHPRPLGPACRHAARTAHRRPHSPVSATRAPQTRNADANATASPVAAAASRSIAAANAAATRTTAHRPVRASIPRARARAKTSTRPGDREGRKSNRRCITRPNRDTWRSSRGIRPLSRGDTRLWAEARGDDDNCRMLLFFGRGIPIFLQGSWLNTFIVFLAPKLFFFIWAGLGWNHLRPMQRRTRNRYVFHSSIDMSFSVPHRTKTKGTENSQHVAACKGRWSDWTKS